MLHGNMVEPAKGFGMPKCMLILADNEKGNGLPVVGFSPNSFIDTYRAFYLCRVKKNASA